MKMTGKDGFTIVELLIGIIAASILALMAGTMLMNAYKGWVRSLALADMERDAAVAIHTLDLAVRGATNAVGGATLTVSLPSNGITRVFSTTGVSPRKSLAYNGMTLVNGRLGSFSATVTGSVVGVTMVVSAIDQNGQDTGVTMGVTNLCIRMRNRP
jgi:prepilin-type N-terminal cleavage/methylation domain-containing protein